MKLTIVVDTEDPRGVEDSFKIVSHFHKRYVSGSYSGTQVSYHKIAFIKMLRKFAKHAVEANKEGIDPQSLRFTKEYADGIFSEIRGL